MPIEYEQFEKYRTHFIPIENTQSEDMHGIEIMLTDESTYGKMAIRYRDVQVGENYTINFKYDVITSEEGFKTSEDFEKYIGDLLITLLIQSLNNIEEAHEGRNNNSF